MVDEKKRQLININPDNPEPTIERIKLFLEDKDWEKGIAYCEAALDYFPMNPDIYLLKLCAMRKISNVNDLKGVMYRQIAETEEFQKMCRFKSNGSFDIDAIVNGTKNAEMERIAREAGSSANKTAYLRAILFLKKIPDYPPAEKKIEEYQQKVAGLEAEAKKKIQAEFDENTLESLERSKPLIARSATILGKEQRIDLSKSLIDKCFENVMACVKEGSPAKMEEAFAFLRVLTDIPSECNDYLEEKKTGAAEYLRKMKKYEAMQKYEAELEPGTYDAIKNAVLIVNDYKDLLDDSDKLHHDCCQKLMAMAQELFDKDTIDDYNSAKEIFDFCETQQVEGAHAKASECERIVNERLQNKQQAEENQADYHNAIALGVTSSGANIKESIAAFEKLGDYKSSEAFVEKLKEKQQKIKKKRTMQFIAAAVIVLLIIAIPVWINNFGKNMYDYHTAEQYLEDGKYDAAMKAFWKLGDYKDSEDKYDEACIKKSLDIMDEHYYIAEETLYKVLDKDTDEYKDANYKLSQVFLSHKRYDKAYAIQQELKEKGYNIPESELQEATIGKIEHAKGGETFIFGSSSKVADLEWMLIGIEEGEITLASKYVIDERELNDKKPAKSKKNKDADDEDDDVTFTNSSLDKWLKGDFFQDTFSDEEKELIIKNNKKPEVSIPIGGYLEESYCDDYFESAIAAGETEGDADEETEGDAEGETDAETEEEADVEPGEFDCWALDYDYDDKAFNLVKVYWYWRNDSYSDSDYSFNESSEEPTGKHGVIPTITVDAKAFAKYCYEHDITVGGESDEQ